MPARTGMGRPKRIPCPFWARVALAGTPLRDIGWATRHFACRRPPSRRIREPELKSDGFRDGPERGLSRVRADEGEGGA